MFSRLNTVQREFLVLDLLMGEVLERLWSFLRRFGMTKEMRPNHRIDVLSDALLFYGKKKTASIGKLCFTAN